MFIDRDRSRRAAAGARRRRDRVGAAQAVSGAKYELESAERLFGSNDGARAHHEPATIPRRSRRRGRPPKRAGGCCGRSICSTVCVRASTAGYAARRAPLLVGVHPLVGDFSASSSIPRSRRHFGAAEAEADAGRQRRSPSCDCANALCRSAPLRTRFLLAARHQHQELVAAPAEHVVGLADVADQERRDLAQHAVAGLVAERVVDALEPVDVDEQQRQRDAVAAVPLELAADDFVEEPAVAAAGQRVGRRPSAAARVCADSSRVLARRSS